MKWNQHNQEPFDYLSWQTIATMLDVPHQGATNHCGMYICLISERISIDMSYSALNPSVLNRRGQWYIMNCLFQQTL